jgi:hypothetical protein
LREEERYGANSPRVPKVAALQACFLILLGVFTAPALSDGTAPAAGATPTPPPQIYHVITTPLCQRLHERVRPAVAMILQNDQTIAKSPPLFERYARGALTAGDKADPNGEGSPQGEDSINNESPETSMALQQMSYLVFPVSHNLIAAQTLLDDPRLLAPTGNADEDVALAKIKSQLLDTIAYQSASLDLINGFVATQQMGEIQHAGTEFIGAIEGSSTPSQPIKDTPNPWQDPDTPGLAPNPYNLDLSTIPGLAVGYNPLKHIEEGLEYLRTETGKREDTAAATITQALKGCN